MGRYERRSRIGQGVGRHLAAMTALRAALAPALPSVLA